MVDGVVNCVGNMPRGGAAHLDLRAHQRHPALHGQDRLGRSGGGPSGTDPPLAEGINVYRSELTYEQVAEAHALAWRPLPEVIPDLADAAG